MVPRNNMDNKTNLRKFQQTLLLLNIKTITFDVNFVIIQDFQSFLDVLCR